MKTIHPDPPCENPTPHPDTRFKPLTSNCDANPTLFLDTQAPLHALNDAAIYRIQAVTQVLETCRCAVRSSASRSSSVTLRCSVRSRCVMVAI
jgi:hypothetical protein